jgi:transposase-like protein
MALSARLRLMELTLECKHCGHSIIKKGGWFVVSSHFKCEGCKRKVRIPYGDKVALFEKHAHMVW